MISCGNFMPFECLNYPLWCDTQSSESFDDEKTKRNLLISAIAEFVIGTLTFIPSAVVNCQPGMFLGVGLWTAAFVSYSCTPHCCDYSEEDVNIIV